MTDPNHPNRMNHPNQTNPPNPPNQRHHPDRPHRSNQPDEGDRWADSDGPTDAPPPSDAPRPADAPGPSDAYRPSDARRPGDARRPDGPDARSRPADSQRPIGPDHPDHLSTPHPPPHPYYQELEFLTPYEAQSRFVVRYGEDHRPPGRPGFLARRAVLGAGAAPVVQYRLTTSAQGDPQAYGLLEREVAAAVALERRYGGAKFGAVLSRIVGFDLTAGEPFVLYRPPAGRPLADWAGRLGAEDQERIIGQLAMAVRLMADVDLVHRMITPETVRWDGARVRLCEPFAAVRAGERREPFGAAPWASPEQRAGQGGADPRDDVWAVAEIAYYLLSGRPDRGEGRPADLADYRRLAALEHSGLFSPRAAERPHPVELLKLLHVPDPLSVGVGPADPLDRWRAEYDTQVARKRDLSRPAGPLPGPAGPVPEPLRDTRAPRTLLGRIFGGDEAARPPVRATVPGPPPEPVPPPRSRMCPHCLLPVEYDERLLVTIDAKGNRVPLDLSAERRPGHLADARRKAYHLCPHTRDGDEGHELPVPYLVNGEPLSIALVGSSSVGKTHLLAAMLGEVELGGLEPYGLKCLPLNPEAHRTYLRERVQSLQQGRQLGRTGQQTFARFADGLLVSAGGAVPRPVVFFDLAGEDLAQDSEVGRFLMGVDAFVFVLDPLRALRLPSLDPVREQSGLRRRDLGDEAFATVLNRIPRQGGGLVAAPAALAVNKSDLVRFEPVVDRWLGPAPPRPPPPPPAGAGGPAPPPGPADPARPPRGQPMRASAG
ncbi:hypothetical protein, partial [Streptomyces venezuelae]|uniref:hypothetical protein n=1 Tax=Streptomyces venezuelae TaxID=54571 RepID=UPI00278C6A6C